MTYLINKEDIHMFFNDPRYSCICRLMDFLLYPLDIVDESYIENTSIRDFIMRVDNNDL